MANTVMMVQAAREHALNLYDRGWDVVVECWMDCEIIEAIGQARTTRGDIRKMALEVLPGYEYRKDIEATAF